MNITFITDGTAEAMALASWAALRGIDARVLEARGAEDLRHVVGQRQLLASGPVVILAGDGTSGDIDARDAWTVATDWLRSKTPFERRALGRNILEEGVRQKRYGADSLVSFLTALGLPSRDAGRHQTSRGGRPKTGKDPFRGTGFDVCATILGVRERVWTQRALAATAARGSSSTHGVVTELIRRGLIEKSAAGWRLERPDLLLEAFASAWRVRTGVPRPAAAYAWHGKGRLPEVIGRAAARAQGSWLLAGPSATQALLGGPMVVYADEVTEAALLEEKVIPTSPARADLLVWSPLEPSVFRLPRQLADGPATSLVVTCLDLLASGTSREREVATALWQNRE